MANFRELADLRENLRAAREQVRVLHAALKDLDTSDILGSAESNASGNPNWEFVSSRINAARAALAKVKP
jgi:hypothetical protein